jgi:hypothetical protein
VSAEPGVGPCLCDPPALATWAALVLLVLVSSELEIGADFRVRRAGVGWLS